MMQMQQFPDNRPVKNFFNINSLEEGFLKLGIGRPLHQLDEKKQNWQNPRTWQFCKLLKFN